MRNEIGIMCSESLRWRERLHDISRVRFLDAHNVRRIYSCMSFGSKELTQSGPALPNKSLAGSRPSGIFRMLTSRIVGCKLEQTCQTHMRKGGAPKKEWRKHRGEEYPADQGFPLSDDDDNEQAASIIVERDSIERLPARIKIVDDTDKFNWRDEEESSPIKLERKVAYSLKEHWEIFFRNKHTLSFIKVWKLRICKTLRFTDKQSRGSDLGRFLVWIYRKMFKWWYIFPFRSCNTCTYRNYIGMN